MLTVIAIIAILAGLILYAASGVLNQSARTRARSEIAGLSSAMEAYKADNGIYPTPWNGATTFSNTNSAYKVSPATGGGSYELSSEYLYQALAGMTNTTDTPTPGVKSYFPFKKTQLGVDTSGAGSVYYIKDPFGNSYGYFSGSGSVVPINGTNAFDLWSTAGDMQGTNQPGWISNWGS
jgi:type II secretory pathway pseudopilin PulG